jgi:hypothetical protein
VVEQIEATAKGVSGPPVLVTKNNISSIPAGFDTASEHLGLRNQRSPKNMGTPENAS